PPTDCMNRGSLFSIQSEVPLHAKRLCFALRERRQPEGEAGPCAHSARRRQVPSHQAGQAATDGQPESYAASRAQMALFHLHERLEYALQLALRNSDAPVGDAYVVPPGGAAYFRIGGSSSLTW